MIAFCHDCGRQFVRDTDELWKVRCLACWAKTKNIARRRAPDQIHRELAENLPRLIQLCHPDKHGASALATSMTQWLLNVRERIQRELHA